MTTSQTTSEIPILKECGFCSNTDPRDCQKCGKPFCHDHVSKISPIFCQDCFKEVVLIIERVTRTDTEYDYVQDEVVSIKSQSKRLRLDGPDWVWYSRAINLLNEEEFKVMWEFHRFVISLMEHVDATRKVAKNARLRDEKIILSVTSSTTTKTKRTAKPVTLREILTKQGLSEDVINAMLAAANQ